LYKNPPNRCLSHAVGPGPAAAYDYAPTFRGVLGSSGMAAKETTVEAHKSSAVNMIAVDGGKRAKDVGMSCSSGPSPAQGLRPETGLNVHVHAGELLADLGHGLHRHVATLPRNYT
jgi:hypothetical protein